MAAEDREEFKEMELWEHLEELRTRLIRALCYVLLGLVVAWAVYPWLKDLFFAPFEAVAKDHKNFEIVYTTFGQGFTLQLQVALVAGLVLAIPLVTLEVWGFVAPGLTRTERKACYLIFPLSLFFFFFGVFCGYAVMEPSVRWFADYIPPEVKLMQDPGKYILFMVKMVVAFGLCFQLPMILMFLAYVGMVSSKVLAQQWRLAVVGCAVVAAVATPGGDPFSMFLMGVPLAILYIASIFLCAFVERIRARQEKKLTEASAPV